MERFHIRESVIFEDILPDEYLKLSNAMKVSRSRMSLQQMLDDPPDTMQLIGKFIEYDTHYNDLLYFLTTNRQIKLNTQPVFHWYINNTSIESSCWLLEPILIKHAISTLYEQEGMSLLRENVKEANKFFKLSVKTREDLISVLNRWKWKHTRNNITQKEWNISKINALKTQQSLAMIDVGISKHSASKTLFTVSQRAIRHASLAYKAWPSEYNQKVLHLSEALRYLFSSNILWSEAKYGQSIYRIEHWLMGDFDAGPYKNIQEQLTGILFLLSERKKDNESIYFHKVEAAPPLIEPYQLMYNNEDIPHPAFEEKVPLNETHETELDLKSAE